MCIRDRYCGTADKKGGSSDQTDSREDLYLKKGETDPYCQSINTGSYCHNEDGRRRDIDGVVTAAIFLLSVFAAAVFAAAVFAAGCRVFYSFADHIDPDYTQKDKGDPMVD